MKVILANSARWPHVHADDAPLVEALESLGATVSTGIWDDPAVQWQRFDVCIIRSTWDFHLKLDAFLRWVGAVASRTLLKNSEVLVRWNSHKSYMLDLNATGVPVVPTVLLRRDGAISVRDVVEARGWPRFIVKPAISASSYRTKLFAAYCEEAEDLATTIAADADVLIQPFVDDVLHGGERSYCVIDGEITHAVRRAPFDGAARGKPQPMVPVRRSDLPLIERTLSVLPEKPLYARLDIVDLEHGFPVIAEVEVIEPNLFLSKHPPSGVAFARAVVAALSGGP